MSRNKPRVTGEGLTVQADYRCPQLATWPGFHGPCHKGHMRCVRAFKKQKARGR